MISDPSFKVMVYLEDEYLNKGGNYGHDYCIIQIERYVLSNDIIVDDLKTLV